jgi:hypothetical protein
MCPVPHRKLNGGHELGEAVPMNRGADLTWSARP